MSKIAFIDTNIAIAYVFSINSLHLKSKTVFNEYTTYCSDFVKEEFEKRYETKLDNLSNFFHDFQKHIINPEQEFFSIFDLKDFALKNYSGKIKQDAKNSIDPFWNEYFGVESQIPFFEMNNTLNKCLKDLSIKTGKNKGDLMHNLHLTPQRAKNYPNIDSMLKSEGIHENDRIVTLDGHDFACKSSKPIDFVTFDDTCYNGVKNIKILCFDSIKGKYDFTAS